MLDINKIKPKIKNQSDKYSWNLYNFLHKQVKQKEVGKYVPKQIKIYWLTHSRWDGKHMEFNPENLHLMQIIISPFGNKGLGYFMNTILTNGKAECFSLPWKDEELLDITDWFFDTYEQIGRCIFNLDHDGWLQGGINRFTYVNNTRKCNWCGKWQKKEIKKKVIIERIYNWV